MTVQRRPADFDDHISIKGRLKLNKIADEQRIMVSNLAMAGRGIVDDYPDICFWYCLVVRTGSEFFVEKFLYDENVEALVPTWKPAPRYSRGRRIEPQSRPVMPGYVMVHCAASAQAFVALRRVKHVLGIIGGAEKPYKIPLNNIEKFKELAKSGAYDHRLVKASYHLGEIVKVADGPFAAFTGEVTGVGGDKHRLTVEVMMFGRKTPIEIDVAQIEKL